MTFAQNVAGQTNHKAGWIGFGPDNLLYIATGDGGSGNDPQGNGQNLTVLLGKMLRIAPSTTPGVGGYTIPADQPVRRQFVRFDRKSSPTGSATRSATASTARPATYTSAT